MKITNIKFLKDKVYVDKKGLLWKVIDEELYGISKENDFKAIKMYYSLKYLLSMKFKKIK